MTNERTNFSDIPEMDYFMNEELSDVWFVIEGQRLPALKSFLSVKNIVFRAMFSDNFKESKDKEVVIKDTTFDAFKTLIQFLYSDEMVLKDKEDTQLMYEVFQISDRYQAFRLTDKMVKHMKTFGFNFNEIELISKISERSQNKGLINKANVRTDFSDIPSMDYFMNKQMSDVLFDINGQQLPVLKSK